MPALKLQRKKQFIRHNVVPTCHKQDINCSSLYMLCCDWLCNTILQLVSTVIYYRDITEILQKGAMVSTHNNRLVFSTTCLWADCIHAANGCHDKTDYLPIECMGSSVVELSPARYTGKVHLLVPTRKPVNSNDLHTHWWMPILRVRDSTTDFANRSS